MWCTGGVFGCLPRLSGLGSAALWVWGLCFVVPRQSWLNGLGAVPRHSWLGSGGGSAFPCPLACSTPSSTWLRCLACCSPGACSGTTRAMVGLRWGWVGGGVVKRWLGSHPLGLSLGGADACTPRQGGTLLYGPSICARSVQMDCVVARYSGRSPHRVRVHRGSQGSPCRRGASLACPDGRCAPPAAPRQARTAVRAVASTPCQAHWSSPQNGADSGR